MTIAVEHSHHRVVREPEGWRAYCDCGWAGAAFWPHPIDAGSEATKHAEAASAPTQWRRPRCRVAGCEREVGFTVVLVVGGEPMLTSWCLPHAAEYRVEEASSS